MWLLQKQDLKTGASPKAILNRHILEEILGTVNAPTHIGIINITEALFGCMCIYFNSHVLEWNEIYFNSTPIHFNTCGLR
jgi:hypothetical protein